MEQQTGNAEKYVVRGRSCSRGTEEVTEAILYAAFIPVGNIKGSEDSIRSDQAWPLKRTAPLALLRSLLFKSNFCHLYSIAIFHFDY